MNNIFEVLRRETAINGYFCLQYFLSVYPSLLLRQLVLILYSYRPETIIYDYIMTENTNLYFWVQSWFPWPSLSRKLPILKSTRRATTLALVETQGHWTNSSFFPKPVFALSRLFSVSLLLHASKTIRTSFHSPRSRYKMIERLKVHGCCLLLFPVIRECSHAFNGVSEPIRRDHF